MEQGKLGILGGMGPQATQIFYQRILDNTAAVCDQEHIETLILSDTKMPDRTQAILSGQTAPVIERLIANAKFLEAWGACCIAVPCNTSHTFLPEMKESVRVPIVDMIAETAREVRLAGAKRVGILATEGTVRGGLYQKALEKEGLSAVVPDREIQASVTEIIYDEIKRGEKGSREKFSRIDAAMRAGGCDRVILACTELSVFRDYHPLSAYYVDAMDILAKRSIEHCGYRLSAF